MRPNVVPRLFIVVVPAVGLLALAAHIAWGDKGTFRMLELQTELREANRSLHELDRDNQGLLRELHALDNDPVIIERIVVDDLGWATEGTTLYAFDEPASEAVLPTQGATEP